MPDKTNFDYVPALRLKAGEYRGLRRLAPDVADRIAPRLVLPPPGDRDPEKQRPLTYDEVLHETGKRIGNHWARRIAFLDPRFLFQPFGDSESAHWLPRIFEVARHHNARPIPVATLDDMTGTRGEAFRLCISHSDRTQFAVRVPSAEADNRLKDRVHLAMATFALEPKDCVLLLDLADADISDPTAIADVTAAALATVDSAGIWQDVVFQASNYPAKNPAKADSFALVDRNEWLAWNQIIQTGDTALGRLIFGDYGADSAEFAFRTGRIPAIRHYRYCTDWHWLVQRGKADVPMLDAMKSVCQNILASGKFAGRDFSSADNFIYETASGLNHGGNATTWRESTLRTTLLR